MKKASDYIKEIFPFVRVITKDRGNSVYYILYKNYDNEDCYEIVSIQRLAIYVNSESYNKLSNRSTKLLYLKWLEDDYLSI